MAFTTPSYALSDLFARVDRGELQLPDFQRSFRWDVDRIRSLLVTVLRGYPIGAFMALDTRNEPMLFRPRPLTGAPHTGAAPGLLLLDGQQRLTTLYHSLQGNGLVETTDFRNKRIQRRFFVDVVKAVENDMMPDEAVFSVDEHGQVRSHFAPALEGPLTSAEAMVEAGCVPVDSLLGQSGTDVLIDMAATANDDIREAIKRFHHNIVAPLAAYDVPMIRLGRETARTGIGSIFAQANTAGVQMDVFELLTAVFAADDPDFSLADEAQRCFDQLADYPVLSEINRTHFLTALSLVVSAKKGKAEGQREDVLALTLDQWKENSPRVVEGFIKAAEFMAQRGVSCGSRSVHLPTSAARGNSSAGRGLV